MRSSVVICITMAAALAATVAGQENPADNPTQPRLPQAPATPRFQSSRIEQYISGKVIMEDGTPPPERALIKVVCVGQEIPATYTDSKGHFTINPGRNSAGLEDASVAQSGGNPAMGSLAGLASGPRPAAFRDQGLQGCEVQASLAGYNSGAVDLTGRQLNASNIGVIMLHKLAKVDGATISMTGLDAPKDARKAFEKGRKAFIKGKSEPARKEFQKAVEIYPKYAAAWYALGTVQEARNDPAGARNSYLKALEADPKYVQPYVKLAGIDTAAKDWRSAAHYSERAIKLDPIDFPHAYLYNCLAEFNLGRMDAAEVSARKLGEFDPHHRFPKTEYLLGVILAFKHDYSSAAEHLSNYLKLAPKAEDAESVRSRLRQLEKLAGAKAQR